MPKIYILLSEGGKKAKKVAVVLKTMRGDFALSREAGNELKPESDSGTMDKEGSRIQSDLMDDGIVLAKMREK